MSDLKERRLKSLDYQIQELENRPNYYKKYWLRLIVIGVLVTLIASIARIYNPCPPSTSKQI